GRQKAVHTLPRNFLEAKIDGRQTFFEWMGSGRYTCQNERGTMAMVASGPLKDVFFGFDMERLLVRIDFERPANLVLPDFDDLRLGFPEPAGWEVIVQNPCKPAQSVRTLREGVAQTRQPGVAVGIDLIAEMAIPFALLRVKPGDPIQFFVELVENRQSRDRAPRDGTIHLTCPSPEFEQIMWDV